MLLGRRAGSLTLLRHMQTYEPRLMKPADVYALLVACVVPRPIALVTTMCANGAINCAPFSFFNGVSSRPPCISISITAGRKGTSKDTLVNIEANKEFVVNASTDAISGEVNACSAELPYGVSEAVATGLALVPSTVVAVPRVARSEWALECRLHACLQVGERDRPGSATLVVGEVVALHVSERVEQHRIDEWKPIARLHGNAYSQIGSVFTLERPKAKT